MSDKEQNQNEQAAESSESEVTTPQESQESAEPQETQDSPEITQESSKPEGAEAAAQETEAAAAAAVNLAPSIAGIEPEKKPIPLKTAPKKGDSTDDDSGISSKHDKEKKNDLSILLGTAEQLEIPKELTPPAKGQVFYATGRRKTSSARVFMQGGTGTITVNGVPIDDYFPFQRVRNLAIQPLLRLKGENIFNLNISVKGGGTEGQAGAIKHGLARALLKYDEELKKFLRKSGYLTRDPRSVERKKVGLHKARKSPQYSKR